MTRFATSTIILHWLMAFMIITYLTAGILVGELTPHQKFTALKVHSGGGLIILALAFYRIYNRRKKGVPEYPDTMPSWEKKAAKGNTHLLYALMVFQPLVGLLHAATYTEFHVVAFGALDLTTLLPSGEGITEFFHVLHGLGALLLIICISLHILAGLKHLLIDRDKVMHRMLPFFKVD